MISELARVQSAHTHEPLRRPELVVNSLLTKESN